VFPQRISRPLRVFQNSFMETRKRISLPSGGFVTVRKLSPMDTLSLGFIPQAFPEAEAKRRRGESVGPSAEEMAQGVKLSIIALTKCASRITTPDGRKLRIVDKELDECGADEITVGEMEQEDASAIVQAVNELSALTREAAAAAKPFPEKQEAVGAASPAGEALRQTADGTLETATR
jgi:hypothetical protein